MNKKPHEELIRRELALLNRTLRRRFAARKRVELGAYMDDGLAFSWAHLNRKAREAVGAAARRINGSDIPPIFENMRDALAFVRGLNSQFAQDESIRMIESEVEKLNEGHRRLGEPRVLHFEPECPDLSQRPAFWWGSNHVREYLNSGGSATTSLPRSLSSERRTSSETRSRGSPRRRRRLELAIPRPRPRPRHRR